MLQIYGLKNGGMYTFVHKLSVGLYTIVHKYIRKYRVNLDFLDEMDEICTVPFFVNVFFDDA